MGAIITDFLKKIGPGNDAVARVPRLEDDKKNCVAFQCKGQCLKSCKRKAAHRDLTPLEAKTLEAFLEEGCKCIGA